MRKLFVAHRALASFVAGCALLCGTLSAQADPIPTAGLQLWLDASNLNGVGNPNPGNATSVGSWTDLSGNGNNASAVGTPTYATSAINGLPAVSFNGAGAGFTGTFPAASFPLNTNMTMYFVGNFNATSANLFQTLMELNAGTPSVSLEFRTYTAAPNAAGGAQLTLREGGADTFLGQPTPLGVNAGNYNIFSVQVLANTPGNAGAVTGGLNGSAVPFLPDPSDPANTPTSGNAYSGPYAIGESTNAIPGAGFQGTIAEMLVYDQALSTGDNTQILNYLDAKYFNAVPEPSTVVLAAFGLVGLLYAARRRRSA